MAKSNDSLERFASGVQHLLDIIEPWETLQAAIRRRAEAIVEQIERRTYTTAIEDTRQAMKDVDDEMKLKHKVDLAVCVFRNAAFTLDRDIRPLFLVEVKKFEESFFDACFLSEWTVLTPVVLRSQVGKFNNEWRRFFEPQEQGQQGNEGNTPHARNTRTEPANGTGGIEGEVPPANPYDALRKYARGLKGQERAVIEALCDSGGVLPIADLAIKDGVNWDEPKKGFANTRRRLNPKLQKKGWKISRHDNAAELIISKARKTR